MPPRLAPGAINLANLLTLLRLLLVPFVIQSILSGHHVWALSLFAVAAWTDVFDGLAARRLGLSTQTGAYLDPIADKCLLSGVFLALAAARIVPWWFVGIVFGAGPLYSSRGRRLPAVLAHPEVPPQRVGKDFHFRPDPDRRRRGWRGTFSNCKY